MNDITQYLTRSEFATEIGVNPQTLKKREEAAEGTDHALGEPIRKGAMKLWHRDSWERMNAGRLSEVIEEAVRLGLVVPMESHKETLAEFRETVYNQGFKAGVDSVTSELPAYEEDSEAAETQGLIRGGFQPLGNLGL